MLRLLLRAQRGADLPPPQSFCNSKGNLSPILKEALVLSCSLGSGVKQVTEARGRGGRSAFAGCGGEGNRGAGAGRELLLLMQGMLV